MSRSSRIAMATCWLVVVFLLLRMAWGGSLFGIVYVLQVTHPAVLFAGASTIVGALAVAMLVARDASAQALWSSIALSFLVIPLSILLASQGHRSAVFVGAAAVIATAIAGRVAPAPPSGVSPPSA